MQVVQGRTLYLQVAEYIKARIVQGIYRKGDRIPSESELMKALNVGRVTVRSGLKLLSDEGYIYAVKGKGCFVGIDYTEMHEDSEAKEFERRFMESTQLRLILEPEIARQVALHADSEAKAAIRASVDPEMHTQADFHSALIAAYGNSIVRDVFGRLYELETEPRQIPLNLPYKQKDFFRQSDEHHRAIMDAIDAGDGDRAYTVMKEHLTYVGERYRSFFRYM